MTGTTLAAANHKVGHKQLLGSTLAPFACFVDHWMFWIHFWK